jgi:hypothetical protein
MIRESPSKNNYIASCVHNSDPRLEFTRIDWVRSSNQFNENFKDAMYFPQSHNYNHIADHVEYVARVRSHYSTINQIADSLGKYNPNKRTFYTCNNDKAIEFPACSVLKVKTPNSYEWVKTSSACLCKVNYPLRVCFNAVTNECLYAARTLGSNKCIGHVSSKTDFKLCVPNSKNDVDKYDTFEILCLKPTPTTLKNLCRIKLRLILDQDNFKIRQLTQLIDENAVEYIVHPHTLRFNQCLLKDQCIVSENGQYKLKLLKNGKLFYLINKSNDYIYLYDNVDCICFNEFGLVVFFVDSTSDFIVTSNSSMCLNFTSSEMKLMNNGTLILTSPFYNFKCVVQFRDDLVSFLNREKPGFLHTYFFEPCDENSDRSDDDDNSSGSSGSSKTDS